MCKINIDNYRLLLYNNNKEAYVLLVYIHSQTIRKNIIQEYEEVGFMNIERNLSDEVANISSLISNAEAEYTSGVVTRKAIPADYKVLFILFRSVTVSNVTHTVAVGSTKERIFYEAVNNFKHSVETFANGNVNIIPTIKEVTDNVNATLTTYLPYTDISDILKDLAPIGMYDAIITASAPNWEYLGGTLPRMFNESYLNDYSFYGYSGCIIDEASDAGSVEQDYDVNYPYLITTNIFIHEWMHQLEEYRYFLRSNNANIIYPFTHAYTSNYQDSPTEAWMYKDNYNWDETYFNNTTVYPNVVERRLTSFYRAVLACDVKYIPDNNRKVGMYPEFWKIVPHKTVIGTYIIQNSSNLYLYGSASANTTYTSSSLSNDVAYQWVVYYDVSASSNYLKRKASIRRAYKPSFSLNDTTCTRIGMYDEGEYYIVNKTLNKVLAFVISGTSVTPKVEVYRTTENEKYSLSLSSGCFYKVSPTVNSLIRYLDLSNAWDGEDNTVSFYVWTGYLDAQTWQFRYINDEYDIIPLASTVRSLSYHDSALHIVSSASINSQKWKLEKVDNGKFIFDGKYKIKDSSTGNYLYGTGNSLKLAATGTEWSIQGVGNNYYKIYATIGGIVKYIDVLNAYDLEGNTVQVQYATGYESAQNWKFMLKLDGTVILVPKLSLDRGIKSTTSDSKLSSNFGTFTLIRTGDL